jgi:hypothetical protein
MNLNLRVLANAGDTTIGSRLSHSQIDSNFIALKAAIDSAGGSISGAFGGTPPNYTLNNSGIPSLASLVGKFLTISTPSTANSAGASNLIITGTGGTAFSSKAITKNGNATLPAGALPANNMVCLMYNGTSFELITDFATYLTKADIGNLEMEVAIAAGTTNINLDFDAAPNRILDLLSHTTFVSVSGAVGKYCSVRVVQSGNKTLSFTTGTSAFKGTSAYTPSTAANAVDWLLFRIRSAGVCELVGFRNNVGA